MSCNSTLREQFPTRKSASFCGILCHETTSQCSLKHLHIVLILNKIVTAYVIFQKGILCRWLNYQYVNDASFHLQRVHHYHLAAQQVIYKTDHDYFAFFFGLIHRELFFFSAFFFLMSKMNSTKSTGTLA